MRTSRVTAIVCAVATVLMMTACDTVPRSAKKADKGDQEVSATDSQSVPDRIVDNLAAADKAMKAGKTSVAMEQLDEAIRLEPSSKHPWLKKAQIYFDARQYGQAISAAQEVQQRDNSDLTAKSILAVSGLRVSADALDQLRKANEVTGSTRTEAESVSKLIREALGEPILVPPTAAGGKAESRTSATRTASRAVSVRPPNVAGAGTVARTATGTLAPTTGAAAGNAGAARAGNPFGALR
jgi:ABC-type Na+ efflux pump permease subunit